MDRLNDLPVTWRSMEGIQERIYNEIDRLRSEVSALNELCNHLEQRIIRLERGTPSSQMGDYL